MAIRIPTGYEQLSSQLVHHVDAVCDRFERALQGKPPESWPVIEDFVTQVSDEGRDPLLRELVVLEIGYRQTIGSPIDRGNYRARFPGLDESWIELVIGRAQATSRSSSLSNLTLAQTAVQNWSIPNYQILEEIGRGGMSVVYRATQLDTNRTVALKVLRDGALANEQVAKRFRREAATMVQLRHPNIVQVLEVGEHCGRPFLVLELADKGSMDRWLHGRVLEADEAAKVVKVLAEAVQHAHDNGVLHRDLKPANVLLCESRSVHRDDATSRPTKSETTNGQSASTLALHGRGPTLKISDFGLAKLLGDQQTVATQTGEMLGTPCYMAPEQAFGRVNEISPCTDVYGLGAILYELLTGCPPFRGATTAETLLSVQQTEPVPPQRIRRTCPSDMATITLKCLEKEQHKRYTSARQLAEDLDRFLHGQPIVARPLSNSERAWRWCRRRPIVAALAASLLLVAVTGVAGVFWQWRKTEHQRRDTADALEKVNAQQDRNQSMLYLHEVTVAHHECLATNVERADELLEACRPELRNWEWYYLKQLCHTDLCSMSGHTLPVWSVAYSPDGRYMASSSGLWGDPTPGEIKIWDAAKGQELHTLKGHLGPIMEVAFHPNGRVLASAGVTWRAGKLGAVILWDVETGEQLRTLDNAGGTFGIAFSPDGQQLATAGSLGMIRVFDFATGKQVGADMGRHQANAFSVAFHPDGKRVASGGRDGSAHIWDVTTREEYFLRDGLKDVRQVSFSPDGRLFAIATHEGLLEIWNTETKTTVAAHHSRNSGIVSFDFSPDGQSLAVATHQDNVEVWDTISGRMDYEFPANSSGALGVAFSPDGSQLASSGRDGKVKVWDLTARREPHRYTMQDSFIADLTAVPGTPYVMSASGRNVDRTFDGVGDYSLRIWDPASAKTSKVFKGHGQYLTCVAFSRGGRLFASGSHDQTVKVWDTESDKALATFKGHEDSIRGVAFLPDNRRVASIAADQRLKIWDIESRAELHSIQLPNKSVNAIVCSLDGRWIATSGDDGIVRLWNPNTGRAVSSLEAHTGSVNTLTFSPNSRLLASAGTDTVIYIWQVGTSEGEFKAVPVLSLRGHDARVTDLAFNPDGQRLASVSGEENVVRLWDLKVGQEAMRLRSVGKPDAKVVFASDGARLFVSGGVYLRVYQAPHEIATREERRQKAEERIADWHRREALRAEQTSFWSAALVHLNSLLESNPDNVALMKRRARANTELGNLELAEREFARVVQLDPKQYLAHSALALVHLKGGHIERFDDTRNALLARYGKTKNPTIANVVLWSFVLRPPPSEVIPQLLAHSDTLVPQAKTPNAKYLFGGTRAFILFRAGQFEDAIQEMQTALPSAKGEGEIFEWCMLAMAHHKLGHAVEARSWYDKAATAMSNKPDTDAVWSTFPRPSWELPMQDELFFAEAREVLGQSER